MREKIYTIPVTEVFQEECECPFCILEKKSEDEYIEYTLGPSLMEPDGRIETNEKGFCHKHFEMLYNKQENKLGLGLIIDTYMLNQNKNLKESYKKNKSGLEKDLNSNFIKNISSKVTSKQSEGKKSIENIINLIEKIENKCTICDKLDKTMKRYIEVTLYLWDKEPDFKKIFESKKGFCLKHFKELLYSSMENMNIKTSAVFSKILIEMQIKNLERIQDEVNWFSKKFDYRYQDEPWKNSKDSISRSIQKIVSYCNLK